MRINKFVASSSSLSRRAADKAVSEGRVAINGRTAVVGDIVDKMDQVTLDGKPLEYTKQRRIIMVNKPGGYVCSRNGQGSDTIYQLLPGELQDLKTIGRLDKNSSGLILLTDDGDFAQKQTHPSQNKQKVYLVELQKELSEANQKRICDSGVELEDYISKFSLESIKSDRRRWKITMSEGRNRQIRRTFAAVGNEVTNLHRISFGDYHLDELEAGKYKQVDFK